MSGAINKFWSRAEIGLARPRSVSANISPGRGGITVHYGGGAQRITSPSQAMARWKQWQSFHMGTRGWADIAYTAGFDDWGNVYAGRGYNTRTAANGTNDANQRFYAFCWIGGEGETPSPKALAALLWLISDARSNGGAGLEVKPHSAFRPTGCPGKPLRDFAATLDGKRQLPEVDAPKPPAPKPPTVKPGETYVVRSGDTLSAIARRHGITLADLISANQLRNPNLLRVGQELTIPGPTSPTPAPAPKPAPAPAPTPSQYAGRGVRAKVDLNYYTSPGWAPANRPAGTVKAGHSFPVVEARVKVGNGHQYRVRNSRGQGPFYITASDRFVTLFNSGATPAPAPAPTPTPAPAPRPSNQYAGKSVRAKQDIRFYDGPRWDRPVGVMKRGHRFPTIEARVKVGNGYQYRVRNSRGQGPFYVTASSQFVDVV